MELLCMTGVEDRLQDSVRPTLEMLRNAGIKVGVSVYDRVEDRLQDSVRPTLEMLRNAGIKVGVSVYDRGKRQAPGQCQAYTGDAP